MEWLAQAAFQLLLVPVLYVTGWLTMKAASLGHWHIQPLWDGIDGPEPASRAISAAIACWAGAAFWVVLIVMLFYMIVA